MLYIFSERVKKKISSQSVQRNSQTVKNYVMKTFQKFRKKNNRLFSYSEARHDITEQYRLKYQLRGYQPLYSY